ncbi:MAG TPA: FAD/NAD(P)-binding oxidoreductase [Anaerolineales bacterium]|nr:FAD/NAD(P)-binding oxidoreductase [Anaerolineales bacterium]
MRRVLILGGGFGGVAAANRLRSLLPSEDEVLLADRRAHFIVGFRKTWALFGHSPLEAGFGRLLDLEKKGIRVIQGEITDLDPAARSADVEGRRLEADALVVALGAQLDPGAVPGFDDHALNVYSAEGIPRAAEVLGSFRGGRVVVGIFGPVYKCPPAPYEIALLAKDFFESRGISVSITVFTPQPMSMPILGEAGCAVIEGRLAAREIRLLTQQRAIAVEPGRVRFAAHNPCPFDLLLGIPPHKVPDVVAQSGLTGGGEWVPVDARTLETRFPGVYAVGDVNAIPMANGKPLPKAGVFAEGEGFVVAERIAAVFAGRESQASFDGEGGCYLEVGGGEAMMVRGSFLAEPSPQVGLSEQSAAYVEDKRDFERQRLETWFG